MNESIFFLNKQINELKLIWFDLVIIKQFNWSIKNELINFFFNKKINELKLIGFD